MGNGYSIISSGRDSTSSTAVDSETMDSASASNEHDSEANTLQLTDDEDPDTRSQEKEEDMREFKKQLEIKRELRQEILTRHRTEKEKLKESLALETKTKLKLIEKNKALNELLLSKNIEVPENLKSSSEDADVLNTVFQMRDELDDIKSSNIKLRSNLADANGALQEAYSEIADLSAQNTESIKQIHALKDVISVSKTLIGMREQQLNELKNKLNEIEKSLADREASMLSTDLRQEYERQLQNIRTLRGLYEERARLAEVTRQGLMRELEEQKELSQAEANKSKELEEKVQQLETEINELKESLENKSDQIRSNRVETQGLKSEMSAVNKLFSQVLLGNKTEQDLDKLVQRLEDHHGLLTQMAEKEDDSEGSSALPKLLLELVSQVEEEVEKLEKDVEKNEAAEIIIDAECEEPSNNQTASNTKAEVIVQNLPKVWRVLMELLSHQNMADKTNDLKVSTCYKSVETKSGPVLVPSVSQTYIRLKDLIVEKLSLVKEVNKMKQLNVHLESRLEEQERRLCLVTTELSKTWHVVGRLRRHHHQLHTHEKILKYELQQKRKLLNELKEELEYCREKWDQAREKNTQSEKDWKNLRAEFSSRKTKSISSSLNNSAESGYSDERPSDESSESNDESEYLNKLPRCIQKHKHSVETAHDSSADFNVAEREDPVSDMLDVAELPLDPQDGDDTHDISTSECCSTDKKDNIIETEDEAAEISIETVPQGDSVFKNNSHEELEEDANITKSETIVSESIPNVTIDAKSIIESIMKQNERLAKRDKKFEDLEKSSEALLIQTKNTVKFGEQLGEALDVLINRPSTSISDEYVSNENNSDFELCPSEHTNQTSENIELTPSISTKDIESAMSVSANISESVSNNTNQDVEYPLRCNTDEVESVQSDTVTEANTVTSEGPQNETASCKEAIKEESETPNEDSQPSTSDTNHEARFAARDLRLKILEEQTKSLVNRVNKTTSKGVKINYKLDELHNIYGSENSRSGTPFEDNEDCSESNDDKSSND